MENLEELNLSLSVLRCNSTYLDGIQLYGQFLIFILQLNKLTFNITRSVYNYDPGIVLQSNEGVQNSFIRRGYEKVASCVHSNPMKTNGECHNYSLPFNFEYFIYLNNSFQGGIFHKVRHLRMSDGRPLEYELIKLLCEDFPVLQFLYLSNNDSPNDKKGSATLITFPYLTYPDLKCAHDDYA